MHTIHGNLLASHGELTIDGERLDDAIADALNLGRRTQGALEDARVGDVTITVEVRPRAH